MFAIKWQNLQQFFPKNMPILFRLQLHGQIRNYSSPGSRNTFDRKVKRIQRNRACLAEDPSIYDYLKDAVASQVVDRVCDVARQFPLALDVGCGRGHIAKHMNKDMIDQLVQCDYAEIPLMQSHDAEDVPTYRVVADEEFLPFSGNTFDLVTSSCSLHWVNDLPLAFKEIHRVLKPDGCVIGTIFTGDTLFELRCSLQLAQEEMEGGFSPHVSPFTQLSDIGGLLTRTGFVMTTIDIDEIVVNYPSISEVMKDLQGMGENNAVSHRPNYLRRSTITRAAQIYKSDYGNDDGSVPATFQIIYFIGWKPDPSHRGPAKRGSANVSFHDLGQVVSDKSS
jgi:NADH dehydrogenase [ubiquinone] 1 alpha subcomplex assembly factor 5